MLQAGTDLGLALTGGVGCSVALLEPDAEHLLFVAASGEGACLVRGMRLPVGRGIAGWAVSSGQAITVDDVRVDARFARDVAEQTGCVPTSTSAVPLPLLDDRASGSDPVDVEETAGLEVLGRTTRREDDDLAVLAALAAVAAAASALARDAQLVRAVVDSPAAALLAELTAAGPAVGSAATAVLATLRHVRGATAAGRDLGGASILV